MKIQYCSDLHLEFEHNSRYLSRNPLVVSGDILIMAGDIVPLHDEFLNDDFFKFISDHYEKVFWVPGNHEFYYKDIKDYSDSFNIKLKKNVHIVHNVAVDYREVRLVFSTLWSRISPANKKNIEQGVSDFRLITHQNKKLRADDFNQLHDISLQFIRDCLAIKNKQTVVVTHHLPSELCNSLEYSNSPINEAFCVDLTGFIEECGANFWIYGHSHFNQKPLFIGNTVLLTNQLGYVKNNEHGTFRNNAYISI